LSKLRELPSVCSKEFVHVLHGSKFRYLGNCILKHHDLDVRQERSTTLAFFVGTDLVLVVMSKGFSTAGPTNSV